MAIFTAEAGGVRGGTDPETLSTETIPLVVDCSASAPSSRRARCPSAVLDRIGEIVRPGVSLNPAGTSYGEHLLRPAARGG